MRVRTCVQLWVPVFLSGFLCVQSVAGADEEFKTLRTRHPLLLESAILPSKGAVGLFTGVEFEEDSGDFPTTKFPLHLYWVLGDRVMVGAAVEALIFNIGTETWSGLTNSGVSVLYQFCAAEGPRPAVTFRQDLLPPTGAFSTGRWNTTSTLLLTWLKERWLFHMNGSYTFGGHDDKPILVSEVDLARFLVGAQYLASDWISLLVSFSGAQPIRPKPFEPSIELGFLVRPGPGWTMQLGLGRSLIETAAPDYLIRVTLGKTF